MNCKSEMFLRDMAGAGAIVLVIWMLVLPARADPPGTLCPATGDGKPSCVCNHPNGVIDLTALSSSNGDAK